MHEHAADSLHSPTSIDTPSVPDPEATKVTAIPGQKVARKLAEFETRRYRNRVARSLSLVLHAVTDPLDERVVIRKEKIIQFHNWVYSTNSQLEVDFIETHQYFGDPKVNTNVMIWDDAIVEKPAKLDEPGTTREPRRSAWATIPESAIKTVKKEELIKAAQELGCVLPISPEELTKDQLLALLKNATI